MSQPRRIGPPLATTSPESRRLKRKRHELPDDLLRQASQRLRVMALVGAALWLLATGLGHIAWYALVPADRRGATLSVIDVIAAASIALSLGLFFYARAREREPRFVLKLGLVYYLATALALGLVAHLGPADDAMSVAPVISWIGAVILIFASLLPSTPLRTFVTGMIAASMNPLAMLVADARGTWHFGPLSNVLVMHYPDYLLVGVAVVISHVITDLGRQVVKAREMGSYQLGELLGRGGMGEVYKATHRMLARPAAIKLVRPDMLAPGSGEPASVALKRFRREAEVAARLRSPHTVELYDFGVTDDQTFYFVMELLDGLDLESLVRETGPLPPNRVIHILRQVCASLAEAHAAGLVHRDIKPANLHLGRLGLEHDFVKVLDFGLVKAAGHDGGDESLATAAGLAVGTPAYMAPEMALSDAIDGRADLYSLGCVAYYLLCGQKVFDGTNAMQVLAKHMRETPPPLSARSPVPVPPALEALVLACLAKTPAERPASAAVLAQQLAAIDTDPWDEMQAQQWWEARRPA